MTPNCGFNLHSAIRRFRNLIWTLYGTLRAYPEKGTRICKSVDLLARWRECCSRCDGHCEEVHDETFFASVVRRRCSLRLSLAVLASLNSPEPLLAQPRKASLTTLRNDCRPKPLVFF